MSAVLIVLLCLMVMSWSLYSSGALDEYEDVQALWCSGTVECWPAAVAGVAPALVGVAMGVTGRPVSLSYRAHRAAVLGAVLAGIPLMWVVAEVIRP